MQQQQARFVPNGRTLCTVSLQKWRRTPLYYMIISGGLSPISAFGRYFALFCDDFSANFLPPDFFHASRPRGGFYCRPMKRQPPCGLRPDMEASNASATNSSSAARRQRPSASPQLGQPRPATSRRRDFEMTSIRPGKYAPDRAEKLHALLGRLRLLSGRRWLRGFLLGCSRSSSARDHRSARLISRDAASFAIFPQTARVAAAQASHYHAATACFALARRRRGERPRGRQRAAIVGFSFSIGSGDHATSMSAQTSRGRLRDNFSVSSGQRLSPFVTLAAAASIRTAALHRRTHITLRWLAIFAYSY